MNEFDTYVFPLIALSLFFLFLLLVWNDGEKQRLEIVSNNENFIIYDECFKIDDKYYCKKQGVDD